MVFKTTNLVVTKEYNIKTHVFRLYPEEPDFSSIFVPVKGKTSETFLRQKNGRDQRSLTDVRNRGPGRKIEVSVVIVKFGSAVSRDWGRKR